MGVGNDLWDELRRDCRRRSTLGAHQRHALGTIHATGVSTSTAPGEEFSRARHALGRSPLAGVTALVLDCDDVLHDATAWRRWVLQLLTRMGLATHYQAFFQLWDREFYDAVCCGKRELDEAFVAYLRAAGLSRGRVHEAAAASLSRQAELNHCRRPLAGVVATLGRLHAQGLVLGILANTPHSATDLKTQLAQAGLAAYVTHVVSSRDLGKIKPAPEAFAAMLEHLGTSAVATAFVGHDAAELAGAAAVGLRTVAFNYRAGAVADVYLQQFEQLAAVVG